MDTDFQSLIEKVSDSLVKKGLKLSIAESCTGGFISNMITNLPGSSQFFEMSVVSYSEKSKRSLLGISSYQLKKYGAISEETAIAMAESILRKAKTDISLSTTGVAGPERMEDRDVGLVYFAVATADRVESRGMKFTGNREEIKRQASLEALKFLNQVIKIWL